MAVDVVQARCALLDKCLKDLLLEAPQLLSHPLLLSFLEISVDDLPVSVLEGGSAHGPTLHAVVEEQASRLFKADDDEGPYCLFARSFGIVFTRLSYPSHMLHKAGQSLFADQ